MTQETVILAGLTLLLIAVWFVVELKKLRREEQRRWHRLVQAFEVRRLNGAELGRGPVTLRGKAETSTPLTSPFGDTSCVGYRLRIFAASGDPWVGMTVFENCLLDVTRVGEFRLRTPEGTVWVRPGSAPAILQAEGPFRRLFESGALAPLLDKLASMELSIDPPKRTELEVWEDAITPTSEIRVRGYLQSRAVGMEDRSRDSENPVLEIVSDGSEDVVLVSGNLQHIVTRLGADRDPLVSKEW